MGLDNLAAARITEGPPLLPSCNVLLTLRIFPKEEGWGKGAARALEYNGASYKEWTEMGCDLRADIFIMERCDSLPPSRCLLGCRGWRSMVKVKNIRLVGSGVSRNTVRTAVLLEKRIR
ncbi:hypothetical protein TNCV_4908861 [Trichonephila clavipes]|uniref:Uncharacterized protein n=1 Tax=Trichonephila clavipes TaxID=2585209 RepID=A0A8X6RNR6_TRICX|nr:hypothetical protein TNCV_4908861 [Trichonephila clavipes]